MREGIEIIGAVGAGLAAMAAFTLSFLLVIGQGIAGTPFGVAFLVGPGVFVVLGGALALAAFRLGLARWPWSR